MGTLSLWVVNNGDHGVGERRLVIECKAELGVGEFVMLHVLVDTGAAVNVIKKRLIPDQFLTTLEEPWRLTAAN